MPNYICIECWTKTADFHQFYQKVIEAQTKYLILSKVLKKEQDDDFVKIQERSEFAVADYDSMFPEDDEHFNSFDEVNEGEQANERHTEDVDVSPTESIEDEYDLKTLDEIEATSNNSSCDKLIDDFDLEENKGEIIEKVKMKTVVIRLTRCRSDDNGSNDSKLLSSTIRKRKRTQNAICDYCQTEISTKYRLKVI